MTEPAPLERAPLSKHTTLELGGPAEYFLQIDERAALLDALRWARARSLPVHVLGGGSNVVISDYGLPGLVVQMQTRGVRASRAADGCVELEVEAGEPWDVLVARAVADDLAGIECLSGIPGLTGATPIQNVGAYGQEVSETIRRVELLDRASLEVVTRTHAECGFGYRTSGFKAEPGRYIVLSVTFGLQEHAGAKLRYAELTRAIASSSPTLSEVRAAVVALRKSKSMVIDPQDENRRSVGSFFLNPILSEVSVRDVAARALAAGVIAATDELPTFAADGGLKLSAAWLIERAGFSKGQRIGQVGISSRHALALVHHGGGTSEALITLARSIRDGVVARFGVELHPEPVLFGLRF
jgi:UDP-N-acetylmuramate dehydrogenase